MASNRKNNTLMLIINAYIIISTIIIVIIGSTAGAGEGQVGEEMIGNGYFKAFTNLSNIFAAVCAAVMLIFNIKNMKNNADSIPRAALVLYYTGASAVGLTFIIVVGFLGPMFQIMGKGYFTMFKNDMFFFHFLNPVLCGFCFAKLVKHHVLGIKENIIAIIPTILYSFLYAYEVVLIQNWSDFYNFTLGGHFEYAPVIMLAMYLISFLIALAQRKLHNRGIVEI